MEPGSQHAHESTYGHRLREFLAGSSAAICVAVFGPLNESHNGYLEVYLNLGLIGVSLLVGFLITSYRNICRQFASSSQLCITQPSISGPSRSSTT